MKILLSRIWLYLSSSPIYVDRQSIFEYFSMMTWILRKRNQGVSNITRVDLWSSYYLIGPTSRAHNCSCATEKKALYYNTWATAAFWCVTKSFTWYPVSKISILPAKNILWVSFQQPFLFLISHCFEIFKSTLSGQD